MRPAGARFVLTYLAGIALAFAVAPKAAAIALATCVVIFGLVILAGCQSDPEALNAPPMLHWCHQGVVTCRRVDWRIGGEYSPGNYSGTRLTCRCGEEPSP